MSCQAASVPSAVAPGTGSWEIMQAGSGNTRILLHQQRSSFEIPPDCELGQNGTVLLNGKSNVQHRPSLLGMEQEAQEAREYKLWQANHPCILQQFQQFAQQSTGRRLVVFMDYDGTLTPIVKNPDRAFLSDQMRQTVRQIAELFPTAIISGRGREKVQAFVQLPELYYAGSHGLDIAGPRLQGQPESCISHQPAAHFEPIMDDVFNIMSQRVASIPGAAVEHNKYCVTVHFRNCEPQYWESVITTVETFMQTRENLKATRGRKVLEIKPQVDWDKGRALAHLLEALGLAEVNTNVLPIYIGDDSTDEDAFRVLKERPAGHGILVSSKAKPTAAAYSLRDPNEVMAFLDKLVSWGRSPSNAWLQSPSCNGWSLQLKSPATPAQQAG